MFATVTRAKAPASGSRLAPPVGRDGDAVLAGTDAPAYGAPIDDVLTYYAANRDAIAVASGVVALCLPLLLVLFNVTQVGLALSAARSRRADVRVRARLGGSCGGLRVRAADGRR